MPTFHEVFVGTAPSLRLCVCLGATNAQREDLTVAIWELDRDWLVRIVTSIAANENEFNRSRGVAEITPEQAAIQCDVTGVENRFFRLDEVVATWLDSTQPIQVNIDYIVM